MVLYAKDIVETEFLSLPPKTSVLTPRGRWLEAIMFRDHHNARDGPMGIVTEMGRACKIVAEGRDPGKSASATS